MHELVTRDLGDPEQAQELAQSESPSHPDDATGASETPPVPEPQRSMLEIIHFVIPDESGLFGALFWSIDFDDCAAVSVGIGNWKGPLMDCD